MVRTGFGTGIRPIPFHSMLIVGAPSSSVGGRLDRFNVVLVAACDDPLDSNIIRWLRLAV